MGRQGKQAVFCLLLLCISSYAQFANADAVLTINGVPATTTPAATAAPTQTPTPAATTATPAATTAAATRTPAATTAASRTPAATPAATTAARTATTTPAAEEEEETPASPRSTTATPAARTPTPAATRASTATTVAATRTPAATTAVPTPAATTAAPTPAATTPAPTRAAPPPPPTNPNATALFAVLQLEGTNLWPWTNAYSQVVVNSLAQTLTAVSTPGINILNVTQVTSRRMRRALQDAGDTVNVNMELEGSSPAAALAINTQLGNSLLDGTLQRTLSSNGLDVSGLSLTNSAATVPQANVQCSSGSYQLTCINDLDGSWSKGKIIGVAVGAGIGALLVLLLCVVCVLKCVNKARSKKAKAARPRHAMTPQHAQPFWETKKTAEQSSNTINVTASSSADQQSASTTTRSETQAIQHVEEKEMGGRLAREQLKFRLPPFQARTYSSKAPAKQPAPIQTRTVPDTIQSPRQP